MAKQEKIIERGGLFIIAHQLEGLCQGLRLTVPHGHKPGNETLIIVKKLKADFASISTGKHLQSLPELSEDSSAVDILVVAETLRATVLAFLSPEEAEEHRKTIGFQSN